MTVSQVPALTSFSAGTTISSANVNSNFTALRTAVNALITADDTLATFQASCRLSNSGLISILDITATAVTWDTETHDTGGMHSTSVNTSRITIPTGQGGLYLFTTYIQWAANNTGYRAVDIRRNGSAISSVSHDADTGGAVIDQTVSSLYLASAADYFEVFVFHNKGSALNVNCTTAGVHFAAAKLS